MWLSWGVEFPRFFWCGFWVTERSIFLGGGGIIEAVSRRLATTLNSEEWLFHKLLVMLFVMFLIVMTFWGGGIIEVVSWRLATT